MNSIPANLKDLFRNLEYVAMIEKGKKPCLSDMTFVEAKGWLGAWKRYRLSESKGNLAAFLECLIDQTFVALQDSRNKDYIPLILNSLSKARAGILNTLETYKDYPAFVSAMRVTISNINLQLKSHSDKLVHN